MPNLYPEGYEEEIITADELVGESQIIGYKRGVAFDHELGDFIRDGKHRLVDSSGVDSWKMWCQNCINTQRYKHLAYSTDFGIEIDEAFKAESRELAESLLTRTITEALMADPYGRTDYISDITYDWIKPDSVLVTCTVHAIDDVTIDITATINQGG